MGACWWRLPLFLLWVGSGVFGALGWGVEAVAGAGALGHAEEDHGVGGAGADGFVQAQFGFEVGEVLVGAGCAGC